MPQLSSEEVLQESTLVQPLPPFHFDPHLKLVSKPFTTTTLPYDLGLQ